jgi:hypothetical protein
MRASDGPEKSFFLKIFPQQGAVGGTKSVLPSTATNFRPEEKRIPQHDQEGWTEKWHCL